MSIEKKVMWTLKDSIIWNSNDFPTTTFLKLRIKCWKLQMFQTHLQSNPLLKICSSQEETRYWRKWKTLTLRRRSLRNLRTSHLWSSTIWEEFMEADIKQHTNFQNFWKMKRKKRTLRMNFNMFVNTSRPIPVLTMSCPLEDKKIHRILYPKQILEVPRPILQSQKFVRSSFKVQHQKYFLLWCSWIPR